MIVNNLYETNSRVVHPDTGDTIVDEFTRSVSEIGQDKADSYFLGWIKKDTLPSNCLCSSLTVDGEEEGQRTFTWENITDDDKFPCGYIGRYIAGANQYNTTVAGDLQYINQLYPEYSCEMEDINTTWNFYLYDSTGEHLLGESGRRGFNIPIKTFARLCMGYIDAAFTIDFEDQSSTPYVTRHFTLTSENIGHLMDDSDDYLEWLDEDDSEQSAHCKLRVAFIGFYVPIGRRYDTRPQYEPFNAQWFVKTTCTLNSMQYDHYAYSQGPDTIYPYNDGSPYRDSGYASYPYIFEYPFKNINNYANKIIQFGVHGEFTETQLQAFISSQNPYIVSNNIIGTRASSSQLVFFPLYKFTDAFKCLCLQYRVDIDVTDNPGSYLQGYIPGRTYATDVTPGDEFLAKWKTGDINDPAFKESLRPWQYENFQENDFTEEDIPEPEPGGDEDDPDENPEDEDPENGPDKNDRGAKIPGIDGNNYPANPSPFVKYGLFSYSDLQDLSLQLWDKPVGFFESIAASQSVNPMDYFLSLRWYPIEFDLSDAQLYPEMFLGRGGKLLVNHKNFAKTVQVINWGKVQVKPFYKNFLDYQPYTKVYIFLPFCGQIELNSTVVMGKTLLLKSACDITDGSIVWQIYNDTDDQPILTKQARLGCEIPITSLNASQMGANIVNASLGTLNTVMGTGGQILDQAKNGALAGSALGPEGAIAGTLIGGTNALLNNTTNLIASFSNLGMASKEIVQLTGGTSGMASSLSDRVPYIIYQRPLATNPPTYGHVTGFICNKAATISSMNGFTVCKNVDTSSIPSATSKEKGMIKKILDTGFYA